MSVGNRGPEADFFLEILGADNGPRALRRTFSPESCSASHWNGSGDGGGVWWSGARVETDACWELARFLSAPKGAGASGVRNYKTLPALGRWFGFEPDEIFSGLVGFGGCKIPRTRMGSPLTVVYVSSRFNLSGLVWVR